MAIKATYIMVMNGSKFVREIPRLIDFSGSLAGEHELQFLTIIYGRACVRKVRGMTMAGKVGIYIGFHSNETQSIGRVC